MKVKWMFLSLFFFQSYPSSSQAIDSLKELIKTETTESKKSFLYNDLSRQYLILQELDSCLHYAQLGKEIALKTGDQVAEAYNLEMEGNFYYYNGLYEKAMEIFTYILKVSDDLNDPDLKASSYSMMGWIYLEQRRFDGAIAAFSQALPNFKARSSDAEDLALAYYGIASVYSYRHSPLKNVELAILFYDSALRVSNGLQRRERAFALAELGSTFIVENKSMTRGEEYLLQAKKLVENDNSHLDTYAYVLTELANVYARDMKAEKANQYAQQAAVIYERLPVYRRITSVYQLLAETFQRIGNFKMAYKMENLNRALSDSLFNHRNIVMVEQIHAQYEAEKKQAEISRLSASNTLNSLNAANNRNIAIIVGVASLFILSLVVLTYYNRSRYQKKIQTLKLQQTLREQKDQIARDLHDSLGGQLSSISIGLSRVDKGVNTELIQWAQEMTDRAIYELRDSLWVMNKESVSIAEIEQRINGLFWHYRKIETPIDLQLKIQDSLANYPLTSSRAGDLYRIIQEATHNSIKHSRANRLQIVIERQNHHIQITISDDGIGFETPEQQEGEHYGMRNMKKRAEQINATFTIDSTPGEGTLILVSIPLTTLNS